MFFPGSRRLAGVERPLGSPRRRHGYLLESGGSCPSSRRHIAGIPGILRLPGGGQHPSGCAQHGGARESRARGGRAASGHQGSDEGGCWALVNNVNIINIINIIIIISNY